MAHKTRTSARYQPDAPARVFGPGPSLARRVGVARVRNASVRRSRSPGSALLLGQGPGDGFLEQSSPESPGDQLAIGADQEGAVGLQCPVIGDDSIKPAVA